MTTQSPPKTKKPRARSPSYPAIDLETAIARARELYQKERENSIPIDVILGHWHYGPGSSNGLVTLAALIKFGLLADEGSGKKRRARLTDLARRIVLDDRPKSPERDAAIREAALNPTIHKELWDKYKGTLASDENLRFELRAERKFTDSAVIAFLKELHSTWAFAKLPEYAIMSEVGADKSAPPKEENVVPSSQTLELPNVKGSEVGKFSYRLSKSLVAEIIYRGSTITVADLERLKKYIDLEKDALAEQN